MVQNRKSPKLKRHPAVKIVRQVLKVQSFSDLTGFYCDYLGMSSFGTASSPLFGFDQEQCLLEFREGASAPHEAKSNDFYWKIGITLRDLDAAVAYLRQRGLTLPEPRQFRDIGYLTHLRDPKGFAIELLQQGFEGRSQPMGSGHPAGCQATLAHITLRVTDIDAAKSYFGHRLGMRLMSVQPVRDLDFCLYFYAWSDEALPDPDLNAVENREWLWRRPYALIELQHLEASGASIRRADPGQAGFDGFAYEAGETAMTRYVAPADLAVLS